MFRPTLERVWRKPMDAVVIFKTLALGALYNLSDDRLSFIRPLGLGVEDRLPDANTVWLYRQALAGLLETLFNQFDSYLARQGDIARGGQILDGRPLMRTIGMMRAKDKI